MQALTTETIIMTTPSDNTRSAEIGMAWYNNCSEAERARWHAAAGSAVPADAYRAFCGQSQADAPAAPAAVAPRIEQPYTLAEIRAKIASHDYNAEHMLQHAMLLLEQIARSWDGCMYDAPGETIDIGADIRAAAARLVAEQPAAVAPLPQGEYPPLPEPALKGSNGICCGNFTTGAQYMGQAETLCCGQPDEAYPDSFIAEQMRAYYDLGRQQPVAVENDVEDNDADR